MKAQNLISSFAAVLFTFASLSAVNYNVAPQQPAATGNHTATITDLAPVTVHPGAAELRAAALMSDMGTVSFATTPSLSRGEGGSDMQQFSLLGSQLVMPYYSFGKKFGRITKE
ncbi:hypothetical protein ACFPPA_07960 [Rhodanobacter ginsengisoli]|uniref:Uncharacterized protein n=1 Tax=Rhodanobacter ginsengisoli TaxID=418646 RepID=A0ABW0QQ17_9GAMM